MPTPGFSELASVSGTIRGYRWWRINERVRLESPYWAAGEWDPRENRARCLVAPPVPLAWVPQRFKVSAGDKPRHDTPIPERTCGCGFYGLWDLPDQGEPSYPWRVNPELSTAIPGNLVFGIAEAWGRVLLGREGWRAEFSRALAMFVPHEIEVAGVCREYPALAIVRDRRALLEFKPERA